MTVAVPEDVETDVEDDEVLVDEVDTEEVAEEAEEEEPEEVWEEDEEMVEDATPDPPQLTGRIKPADPQLSVEVLFLASNMVKTLA